jgi:hypothetical protein
MSMWLSLVLALGGTVTGTVDQIDNGVALVEVRHGWVYVDVVDLPPNILEGTVVTISRE